MKKDKALSQVLLVTVESLVCVCIPGLNANTLFNSVKSCKLIYIKIEAA